LNLEDIVSAVRKSDQALCEQLTDWESLHIGTAHWSHDHPAANQLRDAWLADVPPDEAYHRAESFFAERSLVCRRWVPAQDQPLEPIDALLTPHGWQRVTCDAYYLDNWDALPPPDETAPTILPARAMRRGYRHTYDDVTGATHDVVAGLERLNDASYAAFVARIDDQVVGRAAYLEISDFARLCDVFVLPDHRRRGAARALIAHILQLARRLNPRIVVAAAPADEAPASALLEHAGFAPAGTLTEYTRPD